MGAGIDINLSKMTQRC